MKKQHAFHAFQIVAFVAGVALFAYLLFTTGLTTLARYLRLMGWGFALIVALSAVRNCVRAGSWYLAIEPGQRSISFWKLMNVMLAGEAIKYLTATGPLLGEPAKAAMVRRQIPLLPGFSSVLVENLIYYLTVFVVMFAGLPTLLWLAEVPGNLKLVGLILMGSIAAAIAGAWLSIGQRWYVLARAVERLGSLSMRFRGSPATRGRIEAVALNVRTIEDNLYSFYEQRRGSFYLIFSLNMSAHLINVVEVYMILALLRLPATLLIGFLIEAVTKVINLVFFFVPTRAGVYESGNALLLDALGMGAAPGVALAIIRKLRAFIWVGYGLLILGRMTLNERRREELKV